MSSEWIPYGRQSIDESDIRAVVDVLDSDWLTTGPAVASFESALAEVVGNPVAVLSSGTAALHAAYSAIGLGPGDEVVTTPMTFIATAATAIQLGASVRFADVDPETLNIDPELVVAAITDRTKAIAAVDFAGHPAALDPLLAVSRSHDIVLVEDASHSLGATYKGRPVGSIADVTTFSFHPVKAITTGEGGAVSSDDRGFVGRVRSFRNHGLLREPTDHLISEQGGWHQEVHIPGLNYRLPDVLSALGESQLRKLPMFIDRRVELANRYAAALGAVDGIRLPTVRPDVRHAWHLYPIRVLDGKRRWVFDYMRSRGIGVQVHYLPIHLHPAFVDLGHQRGMYPVAEQAYEELMSLPIFPGLTDSAQDRVVDVLLEGLSS